MNVDVTIYEIPIGWAWLCVHSAFLKARLWKSIPNAKGATRNAQTLYVQLSDLLVLKKRSRKHYRFLLLLH